MTPLLEQVTKEKTFLPQRKPSMGSQKSLCRTCQFVVMEIESMFNTIVDRPFIHDIKVVSSSYHQCMRYLVNGIRGTHGGIYGIYGGVKSLAFKIICLGYYWPILKQEAKSFVQQCKVCQIHDAMQRKSSMNLTPILNPFPFTHWGLDVVRSFPPSIKPVNNI